MSKLHSIRHILISRTLTFVAIIGVLLAAAPTASIRARIETIKFEDTTKIAPGNVPSVGLVESQNSFSMLASSLGAYFVHKATAANISSYWTDIDSPLTNNRPNAIVLVTPNWNPGGVGGTYDNHPIGVRYNTTTNKWAVFNQDLAAMPVSAAFNVLIPSTDATVFVHTATAANIFSAWTNIDSPLTNNRPNAIVLVTPNWNPGGVGGTYDNHPIGVYYNITANKWAVFNQDLAAMPVSAAFNVLITDTTVFVHVATAANISSYWTDIDSPLTNNRPNAIVLVTPSWNPGGVGGTFNNNPIGVRYNTTTNKWAVFNQDLVAMPVSAAFNIKVAITRVYLIIPF